MLLTVVNDLKNKIRDIKKITKALLWAVFGEPLLQGASFPGTFFLKLIFGLSYGKYKKLL